MKRQHIPMYATVLGLFIVGALVAGVQPGTLLFLALVLACPAMMLFMHGGHGGHAAHGQSAGHVRRDHAPDPGTLIKSAKVVDAVPVAGDDRSFPRR